MIEQVQSQLKKTQIATIRTMDDFDPVVSLSDNAQIDNPDVSQASGDYQSGQTFWIRDVALVQVEAAAFGIGEQGFNTEAFGIP